MIKKLLLASMIVLATSFSAFADKLKVDLYMLDRSCDHGWTYIG